MQLEKEIVEAFPWLVDFHGGRNASPSKATLTEASKDFDAVFSDGGIPGQVRDFVALLSPKLMSLAALDCLLEAAEINGVMLPTFMRARDLRQHAVEAVERRRT